MLGFRTLSLALVAALGVVPLAPPEHAHEIETDGHLHLIVHQHWHPHAIVHRAVSPDGRRALDHPDAPVRTFTTVYTTPAPQVPAAPFRTFVGIIQPPDVDAGRASNGFVKLLIDGPPRAPTGLRAPPISHA